jgi:hypothetical protein
MFVILLLANHNIFFYFKVLYERGISDPKNDSNLNLIRTLVKNQIKNPDKIILVIEFDSVTMTL